MTDFVSVGGDDMRGEHRAMEIADRITPPAAAQPHALTAETVFHHGRTQSACLAACLDIAKRQGRIQTDTQIELFLSDSAALIRCEFGEFNFDRRFSFVDLAPAPPIVIEHWANEFVDGLAKFRAYVEDKAGPFSTGPGPLRGSMGMIRRPNR